MDMRSRFPDRKISETIIDFAKPVLEMLPPDATPEAVTDVIKITSLAWNAVVFADAKGNDEYLRELRTRLAEHPDRAVFMNLLVERKRSCFSEDMRLIGDYRVSWSNGEIHLWAEARSPFVGQNSEG